MGKHSRPESDVLLAVQQYEQLVTVLYHHRPGTRSGLCLVCGIGWPCTEVWLPLERGQMGGEPDDAPTRGNEPTTRNGEQ